MLRSLLRFRGVNAAIWHRGFGSASVTENMGLVELREYTLEPSGIKDFMKLTGDDKFLQLRKSLLPFKGWVEPWAQPPHTR